MKPTAILFFLFVLATQFSACAQAHLLPATGSRGQENLATLETDILALINQHRKKLGLGALQMLDVASAAAVQHSSNMVKGQVAFGHDGFESRVAAIRNVTGFIKGAAENVAFGQLTASEVVDGWLHSPGHKKNIEGDYNLTGIGTIQRRDGVIYFTQIFIKK